jgi:hypothetical protein
VTEGAGYIGRNRSLGEGITSFKSAGACVGQAAHQRRTISTFSGDIAGSVSRDERRTVRRVFGALA